MLVTHRGERVKKPLYSYNKTILGFKCMFVDMNIFWDQVHGLALKKAQLFTFSL